jgi:hypothetical protein
MGNREVKSFIFICVFVLILSAISIIAYINIRDAWMVKAVMPAQKTRKNL